MLVMFFLYFFFLSPRVLRGPSADRRETWPHDRKPGPALGMFEVFGRTGPQNLGEGAAILDRQKLICHFERLRCLYGVSCQQIPVDLSLERRHKLTLPQKKGHLLAKTFIIRLLHKDIY